jgi:hypothetical protein
MKNTIIFFTGATFGGFIVYVFFFLFSIEWREIGDKEFHI